MAVNVNPMEGALRLVVKDYKSLREAADLANAIPLGMEKLDTRQAATRFSQMSQGQKQGMIDEMGIDKVMEIVKQIGK